MATNNSSASAKTHVSLRLPTYILESIDAHAEKENISRTEAFVFYLQTGLDIADNKEKEPSKDELLLQSIQNDLTVIKAMLASPEYLQQVSAEDAAAAVEAEQAQTAATAESEAVAESEFSASDAVAEEPFAQEEEPSNNDAEAVEEAAEAEEVVEPVDEFTTSDAVSEDELSAEVTFTAEEAEEEELVEEVEEESADDQAEAELVESSEEELAEEDAENALSQKKLEKAVSKAAKQIDAIEKVWLYGPAADEKEITAPIVDLCVKAEDDKIKPKHVDAFVAALEEKTGKTVKVALKHEAKDDEAKQAMKNKVEIYKK